MDSTPTQHFEFADQAHPSQYADSPVARALSQPLMLGLFLPIQSGGWSTSTLERSTDWSFAYNLALTRQAEALGFDLVFGLAQWLGKTGMGGASNFREQSLDPFVTTAALSAATSRILLISTVHVLYGPWHPLHLAKFGSTLDHISGGRWGLNLVTGYAQNEPRMFGMQRIEHDLRYEMSSEFVSILKKLWQTDANSTINGRWWQLQDAFVSPRPRYGRPLLVNAGGSPAGIDYAAAHSDVMFITSPAGADIDAALQVLPGHIKKIQQAALAKGRRIKTIINPTIVCKDTDEEAHDYLDAILAHTDQEATHNFDEHKRSGDAQSWNRNLHPRRALGGNLQIIGSPQTVFRKLAALKAAGIDGVQLTFFDFAPDLAHFGRTVLPLLEQAGLRNPSFTAPQP